MMAEVAIVLALSLRAAAGFGPYVAPGVVDDAPPATVPPVLAPVSVPVFVPVLGIPPVVRVGNPIRRVETTESMVAFTFDACATRTQGYGFDRAVFDVLKREQIPATLFVSGRWVESHPDVMAELAADPLIEFGDHSYDHPHMAQLDPRKIADELDRTEAALGLYAKRSVAFRPPFGTWSRRLIEVAKRKLLPTVTWDVVSGDPSARTTKDGMIKRVLGGVRGGSIVVFHINGRGHKTAEALPEIVRDLRERGFRFVQVSELIGVVPAATDTISTATAATTR
jgi:peptidoglycan-N-acetylglucosamine deacetylase